MPLTGGETIKRLAASRSPSGSVSLASTLMVPVAPFTTVAVSGTATGGGSGGGTGGVTVAVTVAVAQPPPPVSHTWYTKPSAPVKPGAGV